ncbi:MAG: hypothetical protein AB2L24_05595 [Mangrovibacterium sp.]
MKAKYLFFVFAVFSLTGSSLPSYGQFRLLQDSLIKTTERKFDSNTLIVRYSDRINTTDFFPRPEFDNEHVELLKTELTSDEDLLKVVQQVFSPEEIKYLSDKKCYVSCLILSSGKIVSASIYFIGNDPDIKLEQLVKFSKLIRENLTFTLVFSGEIKQEGYLSFSFPPFKIISQVTKKDQ